jgi:4-amino-4-deoxy-L-arabinose transferase-like glycosyltransferase
METVLPPEREASITAVDAPADAAGARPGRSAARPPGEGPPRGPAPTARVEPWPQRLGHPTRSGWITAAIAALATVLYTWSLASVGYANGYYAAAVKSASVSWKALFFGSIDSGNFITVDKPPAALWLQGLSARIFGFSSWSMLLPEALAGVASVLILHRLVRRWAGDTAAHFAALAFALTPVAVVMFRYNNPDAVLTLLGLAAAWALWSALESGRTRMLVLTGALVGLAFNAKMLQAFLVLPAFGLVYLWAGPPRLRCRIGQLLAAGATMVVSAGWWVAVVALWPASARPYIGSTTDNSILSLVFGYNGLSRLFGRSAGGGAGGAGAPGGGGGGTGFGGAANWLRMFNGEVGGQVAWLIPLALAGLLAGLWLTRRAPRTDRGRAGWLLWGTWALTCGAVFSLSSGIFHPYYTVQLAPAVAALAGAGGVALWRLGRRSPWMQWGLPVAVVLTAGWGVVLLARTPAFVPWLRPLIIAGATIGSVGLWLGSQFRMRSLVKIAAAVALVTLLAGPTAYAVETVMHPASGSLASAGPSSSGSAGRGGGRGGVTTTDSTLVDYLEANRGDATYLVATFGSQSSESIIIATGEPVMTIGGFSGSDPAPTLAQFQQLVAEGQVRYVLVSRNGVGGAGGPRGSTGTSQSISSWVTANGTQVSLTGTTGTLFDLSGVTS